MHDIICGHVQENHTVNIIIDYGQFLSQLLCFMPSVSLTRSNVLDALLFTNLLAINIIIYLCSTFTWHKMSQLATALMWQALCRWYCSICLWYNYITVYTCKQIVCNIKHSKIKLRRKLRRSNSDSGNYHRLSRFSLDITDLAEQRIADTQKISQ